MIGDHRLDFAQAGGYAQRVKFLCPITDIGVGVFLISDDDIGGAAHDFGQMAVQIKLNPHHHIRIRYRRRRR